ncbi:MAG TPA: AAA family ATPase [Ktedonobacterales bacterium]|jgi:RecA-family ATPase
MDSGKDLGMRGSEQFDVGYEATALLAQYWPHMGQRDEAAKDLAGMLLRAGWPEAEVNAFVRLVARTAGDEEWRQRGKARTTGRKLAAGGEVTGAPSLARRLTGDGERVVAQVRAWLGLSTQSARSHASGRMIAPMEEEETMDNIHMEVEPWSVLASEVEERQVSWLWKGRIPLGAITLLDGDPGLGKSLITLDLAARVTRGREMPDGTDGVDGGVVLLSAEDALAATVRPRLAAAGADLDRVEMMRGVTLYGSSGATNPTQRRDVLLPRDIREIERLIWQVEARLVVIDPLMAYLDLKVNSWRDQDVRRALAPLAALAERTGAAILVLRHLNKATGMNAIYRGGGSIGIVAAARSGLLVAKHPDDPEHQRVLAATKSNLGPSLPSLSYRITTSWDSEGIPWIEWQGECALSAEQALAAPQPEQDGARSSKLEEAVEWLHTKLAKGPVLGRVVERAARGAGISDATLRRARGRLPIYIQRTGFGADMYTWWSLPVSELDPKIQKLLAEAGGEPAAIGYTLSDLEHPHLIKPSNPAQPEIIHNTDDNEQH